MTVRVVAGALLLVSVLGACTQDQPPAEPTDAPGAVATPLASPNPEGTSPSPSPAPSPSPSPSPSPTTEEAAELDEEAALAAARDRRAEREDCDDIPDGGHEVVAETGGVLLVHVICFVGAYQSNGELRVWDGTELRPVTVEQWRFGEVVDTPEVVGFVEADQDGTTIFNDVKYRGLGDCGLTQTWSFDGTALLLQEARERECPDDEEEFVPPSEWPVVFER